MHYMDLHVEDAVTLISSNIDAAERWNRTINQFLYFGSTDNITSYIKRVLIKRPSGSGKNENKVVLTCKMNKILGK